MTDRDYQHLLDAVQNAIDSDDGGTILWQLKTVPAAANDNGAEWALMPFPQGWQASP